MILKFQRANRMRDSLERIRDRMGEVVQRVNAPLIAGAMVRGVTDPVDRGIAKIDVRASHVDLEAEHMGAIGKFARTHPAKEGKILLGAALPIGAVLPRLGQRTARGAHFFGRLAVDVRQAMLDEPLGEAIQMIVIVRRVVAMRAPVITQPADGFGDRVLVFDVLLEWIRVVEAQMTDTVVLGREAEVQHDRLGVPEMQISVRLRRESRDHATAVFSATVILGDDRAQKVCADRFARILGGFAFGGFALRVDGAAGGEECNKTGDG